MSLILSKIIEVLSWLAVPVGLVCLVDDWLLRPARRARAGGVPPAKPAVITFCYRALPILLVAVVLWILATQRVNFSLVLVIITAVSGLIWLVDALLLAPRRRRAAEAPGADGSARIEPTTVDYARSFFPVALAVLLLRAFVIEPFRIPSDSMMPTLLDGDFIVVDKFAYGLRLPVIHTKILDTGEPHRGDVMVFRPPLHPSQDWIKRVVGLPGDHVVVRDDRITINGQAVPFKVTGTYDDGCYQNMEIATEHLGMHIHHALLCPVPLEETSDPLPTCARADTHGYICGGTPPPDALPLLEQKVVDMTVPPGEYMVMGDNRDNSDDSRVWGFVPEKDLVGKAEFIWFNWDIARKGGPIWGRIGKEIH